MATDFNLDSFHSMTINFKTISHAICNNWVVMSYSELVVEKTQTPIKGISI